MNFESLRGDELRIEIFTRLFQMDTMSVDKRYGKNCELCPEKTNCHLLLFKQEDIDFVFNKMEAKAENLKRPLTKKEKTAVLNKELKTRNEPQYFLNKWGKDIFE